MPLPEKRLDRIVNIILAIHPARQNLLVIPQMLVQHIDEVAGAAVTTPEGTLPSELDSCKRAGASQRPRRSAGRRQPSPDRPPDEGFIPLRLRPRHRRPALAIALAQSCLADRCNRRRIRRSRGSPRRDHSSAAEPGDIPFQPPNQCHCRRHRCTAQKMTNA